MVSLFFILPFIFLILKRGGIGVSKPDEVDEQVLLALDFLAVHTEACRIYLSHIAWFLLTYTKVPIPAFREGRYYRP